MGDEIRFYRASERPWGALSNLYRREIEFEGDVFATSEHAYQAGKARKPVCRELNWPRSGCSLRTHSASPGVAARIASA